MRWARFSRRTIQTNASAVAVGFSLWLLASSLRLLPLVLANALSSPACAAACAPEQAMAEKCSCIFGIPAIHGGQMALR